MIPTPIREAGQPFRQRGKHAGLISHGFNQPMQSVAFHANGPAPLTRRVLLGDDIHGELHRRIVVHELIGVGAEQRAYCEPHTHDFLEINLLLSLSRLLYEITLGDETYVVEAPASICVPAGLSHSANVLEGSGFFVALMDCADYTSSAPPPLDGDAKNTAADADEGTLNHEYHRR